ncbi:DUF2634 domain-containing protein [Clostridium sp. BJN0001]|uniref:DUF2634 domain-containing protein n=1 Tax=Clostridium sp. BJN0001 TaxID=2930219 RepID=UPI001FD52314|nr:DUF2634 domain-containing protein [Clostridium sp. BJN0001]
MITPAQLGFSENNNDYGKTSVSSGKSFLFDFQKGEFATDDKGNLIETNGIESLKMWIEKVLKTDVNSFDIYKDTNYGIESLLDLVTSDFPMAFKKAEIKKIVTTALLKNSDIRFIENFKFERNKRLLTVRFDCSTIYGTVKSEVSF